MDIDWGNEGELETGQESEVPMQINDEKPKQKSSTGKLLIGCAVAFFAAVFCLLVIAIASAGIWFYFSSSEGKKLDPTPDIETVELSEIEAAVSEYWTRRPAFESELYAEAEKLCEAKKISDLEQLKAWFAKNKKQVGDQAAIPLRPFFDALNGIEFDDTDLDERTMHEISKALKGL